MRFRRFLPLLALLVPLVAGCGSGYRQQAQVDQEYLQEASGYGVGEVQTTESVALHGDVAPMAPPSVQSYRQSANEDRYAPAPQKMKSAGSPGGPTYVQSKPGDGPASKAPIAKGEDGPAPAAAVVYFGYLKLRVKRLLDAVDEITKSTEKAGGYVESLGARTIVLRIPAKDFEAVMDTFARVGDVLDRRVKAMDVTAQITDLGARLGVAREARARLLALLEKTADVQERLKILQETKRLTEQIESIESTLSTLQSLVDFYTITIDLVPIVEAGRTAPHRSPFRWVRALTAHQPTLEDGRTEVAMTVPEGFVLFDKDDLWRAQAADTSQVRAARVDNEPAGDNVYWCDAVAFEMDGRDEETVEAGTEGPLSFRVYRNKDVRPRYYLVAVAARGDRLWVVEAFFPNEDAYKMHREAVRKALATFGTR
jgi:hypothetical protein